MQAEAFKEALGSLLGMSAEFVDAEPRMCTTVNYYHLSIFDVGVGMISTLLCRMISAALSRAG